MKKLRRRSNRPNISAFRNQGVLLNTPAEIRQRLSKISDLDELVSLARMLGNENGARFLRGIILERLRELKEQGVEDVDYRLKEVFFMNYYSSRFYLDSISVILNRAVREMYK